MTKIVIVYDYDLIGIIINIIELCIGPGNDVEESKSNKKNFPTVKFHVPLG